MAEPFLRVTDAVLLVVEDDRASRQLLTAMLERAGYEHIYVAGDGDEAVRRFTEHHPDLVLLDLHLAPGDGFDVMARIHAATPREDFLPIMVLTGDSTSEARMRALDEGAQDFLLKPFDFSELRLRVRNLLQTRRLHCLLQRRTVRLEEQLDLAEQPRRAAEHELRAIQTRIRAALEDDSPTMYFQPIVDLANGGIVGAEALARFPSEPTRTPDRWFADAAKVGLGIELEVRAAERAIAAFSQLLDDCFLSINLSAPALCSERFAAVAARRDPSSLVLELTEHDPIADYDVIERTLAPLREEGLRLAVDDTGAGYASLRHILRLRPDIIKLDRAIISGLDQDPARRALVASLVHFAVDTGAAVVAEGVETEGEHEMLASLGVSLGQGYLFCRPQPLPFPDRQRAA